ncbi:unnamed protein product [Heterosigma akashiwo]|mmetsp:Transcript_5528/g.7731  ORF Transcript_5528/g.7731 Transcript_5528/m.7731 type:complete len:221 (-) Transcript_5528:120-782(-)
MKIAAILALLVCLVAFAQAFVSVPKGNGAPRTSSSLNVMPKAQQNAMTSAVAKFEADYPMFYKAGMGPTTKAERWNGRHAMFGWVMIIASAYAKGHGLIPNADLPLDLSDWGTLATLYGNEAITNERAVIMVAHMHALSVSIMAAFAPLSFQDTLLLEEGEEAEPPAGLFVPLEPGLTKNAELLNGRLAMLGLTVTTFVSLINGQSFLDTVNAGLGGMLF